MKLKLITTVVGFLAFSLPTFPQSAKPSVGAGPPSHPVAPANPNTILNRDFNNMTKTGRKGDHLTGSVALEGGSFPWDSIPVTVTCDGQIRYTTATDPKKATSRSRIETSAIPPISGRLLCVARRGSQLLDLILAQKGDSADALEHLRNCLTYFPPGPDRDLVKQQVAQIQPAVQAPK
jgi:hypothetical protein